MNRPAVARDAKVTRDFPTFFFHLKRTDFYPSVCIDVGAADGTKSIYQAFPEALHVVFEPLPDFLPQLKETMKPYRHQIHRCALMETPSAKKLARVEGLYGSSMMHSRKEGAPGVVDVEVSTLDEKMKGVDLSGSVLLKTDCQGADLFVLKGGLETLKKTDIVIVESSFFRFWGAHHPDFYDIVTFMKAQGFVVYDLLEGSFRPSDGALGQVDVVFAKENGPLRASQYW